MYCVSEKYLEKHMLNGVHYTLLVLFNLEANLFILFANAQFSEILYHIIAWLSSIGIVVVQQKLSFENGRFSKP